MTEVDEQEQELPVWDVSTHGPLRPGLEGRYRVVGVPANYTPPPPATSEVVGLGGQPGEDNADGPTPSGDGQPAADATDQGGAGDGEQQAPDEAPTGSAEEVRTTAPTTIVHNDPAATGETAVTADGPQLPGAEPPDPAGIGESVAPPAGSMIGGLPAGQHGSDTAQHAAPES
jgi:hypothetical protein